MSNERVAPAAPVAPQTPFEDPSSAEFFESPAKVTRAIVEETVRKQLREIVDPLMADMRVQKSVGMIDGLKKQYPDFDAHWPYITDQLGKYGIALDAANEETLETLYLKSVGLSSIRGVRPAEGDRSRAAPPQHRPSNQPIPPVQPAKTVRELTEGERRMARIQGFKTDDEYLKYQELYADEVLGGEA
jgi:hypothetical protein